MHGLTDLTRRLWRGYADTRTRLTRQGSPTPALRSLGHPPRADLPEWTARLSELHGDYRRDNPPLDGGVTVVCVSRRPHLLDQVVANVARQEGVDIEFVLVANSEGFDDDALDTATKTFANMSVIVDRDASLGACLNRAFDVSTSPRFVAKFDDDDHYGPAYLRDSLRAHSYAGAGVVGKHTYYAMLDATGQHVLRFPGHEFSYSSTLAGGTLVIDRARTGTLRFPDISFEEDRGFLEMCHRRGISTFAADRFNFLQHRGTDNTWVIHDDDFVTGCELVNATDAVHVFDR